MLDLVIIDFYLKLFLIFLTNFKQVSLTKIYLSLNSRHLIIIFFLYLANFFLLFMVLKFHLIRHLVFDFYWIFI